MAPPHSSADTPVMRQFLEVKSRYPDAIVMFRMGDFYEMFFEDAVAAAPILDIALTSRDKGVEDPVPMAGIPHHALGGYLRTLVERGLKVAICEQMETPDEARRRRGAKIVRREVVRVVTPGALIDEEHLQGGEPNYLAAVVWPGALSGPAAIALLDISSGEFVVIETEDGEGTRAELARFGPKEILVGGNGNGSGSGKEAGWVKGALGMGCPHVEARPVVGAEAAGKVAALAEAGGTGELSEAVAEAAGAAVTYAEATQPGQTLLLHRLRRHEPAGHLRLDEASVRNLELFRTLRDGDRKGSVLWAIDGTKTAMGARMLRRWLAAPTGALPEIHRRQEGIAALLAEPRLRAAVQSRLKDVRDVVRLAARARLQTATPRELGALRTSLGALPGLRQLLGELSERRTDRATPEALDLGGDLLADLRKDLGRTLVDEPPGHARDGGMIRAGADAALDQQRRLRDGGREALAAIETRERKRTQIPSLKVQHNRVFGYFLEVPKAHLARVPADYVRKQTLAGAERYVTEELAGHESKVLAAQAQALARETELFTALRIRVSDAGERLIAVGDRLAQLDVLAGLAEIAERHGYCRPEVTDGPGLTIVEGRHPVVERMLGPGRFVPNDTRLQARGTGTEAARLWLVTGPNMGGKSTVMRQTALIAILAHMGSYVPAAEASVGRIDRVFTRVGAADDLGRGDSTFMVEMREAAQILSQASDRSLVLLDEIGRGTATFDGLALAWAMAEYLHDQIGCRTMFATHYHELCDLATTLAGAANVHVTVHEQRGKIVFLHRVEPGAAGRSYGIAVGRLAGLPAPVLRRAARILERLEADQRVGSRPQLDLFAPKTADPGSPQTAEADADVLAELAACDPDDLSPRDAHDLVRAWVGRVRN